jgi:hypothetical protein
MGALLIRPSGGPSWAALPSARGCSPTATTVKHQILANNPLTLNGSRLLVANGDLMGPLAPRSAPSVLFGRRIS